MLQLVKKTPHARYFMVLADNYEQLGDYNESIFYFNKAILYFHNTVDKEKVNLRIKNVQAKAIKKKYN
jgi:hypothetical protein